ncbi:DtxR family iron (metal) dependent repressor [Neolewinella xylanilytica]|uniref:Transcriptional regulator MntR n=1 Tax=Neolewinella xylanilytica TaxID=1514080 RepID=A0A2S6I503_9BACT|nr:metal-dependent transcriptional regulator [Neolewinella xylanilytica]PPK86171.1 DtxR family iron (metal) dependent repressor [Neolewinella xylanilytica]
MATPTVENYLKAMLALTRESGAVTISDLSTELGVSKPTANNMIRRLSERGLIHYQKYQPLRLTEQGRRQAALVVRKHRLTEMYLVKKMGFGWEEVHPIAEQIEHIDSPAFFEKMDQLLGSPNYDPHGSPIPDREGNLRGTDRERLGECQAGAVVVLAGLNDSSADFLRYLDEKGLRLGTLMKIEAIDAYDKSVRLSYGGKETTLPETTVQQLLVVKPSHDPSSGSATK